MDPDRFGDAGELDPRLYQELRALAADFLGRERADHTLQATALVHEAWIRLNSQDESRWSDRAHFFCIAAQCMRRILIDHARRKGAGKRAGERHGITLIAEHAPSSEACGVDVLTVDDAIRRLEAVDGRLARVVELRFFAGLTVDEVAQALQVSARTVASDWRLARAWLSREFDGERAP